MARSVRPDLVDGQYEVGTDMDVDINLQYPTPIGHATVIGNGLRVRLQPHATALQVGSLANRDRVEVWERWVSGRWCVAVTCTGGQPRVFWSVRKLRVVIADGH